MAAGDQQHDHPGQVTTLLKQWREGSGEALDALVPLVYDELRRIAHLHMRGERPNHTLEPTALVHQAYERLLHVELDWRDRAHFLNMASRTMRRVLVDHARARQREKRGGELAQVTLTDHNLHGRNLDRGSAPLPAARDILSLDSALRDLDRLDPRKAGLVEAHYFGGLTYRELAESFDLSEATVHRELRLAKAWLARALD